MLGAGNDRAAPMQRAIALVGAIAAPGGTPYFFKMLGPSARVRAARPAFDAMGEMFAYWDDIDIWVDGKTVSFRCRVPERDVMVINNGKCTLAN